MRLAQGDVVGHFIKKNALLPVDRFLGRLRISLGDCLVKSGIGREEKYPVKWYFVISNSQRLRNLMNEDGKTHSCLFDPESRDEWERHDQVSLTVARTQHNSQASKSAQLENHAF